MSPHHFEFPDVHEVSHVSAHPEMGARPVTCEHGSLPVAPGLPAAEFPSTAGAGVGGMAPLTKAGEGVPAASTRLGSEPPLARTYFEHAMTDDHFGRRGGYEQHEFTEKQYAEMDDDIDPWGDD